VEPRTSDFLTDSLTIEIGKYPAEMHRPSGSEEHAEVDLGRRRDNTLIEHHPRLECERSKRSKPYLLCGGR
jgi:hypothetical protein